MKAFGVGEVLNLFVIKISFKNLDWISPKESFNKFRL